MAFGEDFCRLLWYGNSGQNFALKNTLVGTFQSLPPFITPSSLRRLHRPQRPALSPSYLHHPAAVPIVPPSSSTRTTRRSLSFLPFSATRNARHLIGPPSALRRPSIVPVGPPSAPSSIRSPLHGRRGGKIRHSFLPFVQCDSKLETLDPCLRPLRMDRGFARSETDEGFAWDSVLS